MLAAKRIDQIGVVALGDICPTARSQPDDLEVGFTGYRLRSTAAAQMIADDSTNQFGHRDPFSGGLGAKRLMLLPVQIHHRPGTHVFPPKDSIMMSLS
jgi:hypothetical protein